jgi:hypothetical protein
MSRLIRNEDQSEILNEDGVTPIEMVREEVGVIDQQTATLGGSVNFGGKVTFQ